MSTAKAALFRPAQEFVRSLQEDPETMAKIKSTGLPLQDLAKEADADRWSAASAIWGNDRWLYRFAVTVLGVLALITAVGAIVLTVVPSPPRDVPQVLIALGSAAVGALVGLFAPSPLKESAKQ